MSTLATTNSSPVRLAERALGRSPYAPPTPEYRIDLHLDANEGSPAPETVIAALSQLTGEDLRRYPDARPLERQIAALLGVDAERVLVCAGGDDAIDRACRACLEPGRELILPTPTFEMIRRSAELAGASVRTVPWVADAYPTSAVLAEVTDRTSMIAVVSPNNPTGLVADAHALEALSAAAPSALLLVDLAYTEFASDDLTQAALRLPNALVVRTFSKFCGLAGLRVGYCIGDARVIRALRAVGSPYPVSAASLRIASASLEPAAARERSAVRAGVIANRQRIASVLKTLGASTVPSQANFVLARLGEPARVARGLAALGIAVRQFPGTPELRDALRITIPTSAADTDRLVRSLRSVMRPEALLLDMDGVIANVAESYRRAIVLAAGSFGVSVTREDVEAAKARGDANNDWIVTQRLLADAGVRADLAAVTERFEAFYTGTAGDGEGPLFERETMIPSRRTLEDLAALLPIAIVTGRPRRDCDRFLDRFGIRGLFGAIVCMEDAPRKPDPAPVAMAMARLRVTSAWMVGDTSDDLVAARGAGALPIGVIPPGTDASRLERVLRMSGAAEVHASLESIASSLKQLLAPASEASE